MMKDKVLVSFASYNAPAFLEHLISSIERYDAGYPFDLLIVNNGSSDPLQLRLLEKYAKKYRVEDRENYGRAQGGYDFAWQNNKDYKYYFFLHDDSAILRSNWLKVAVDRVEDESYESCLPESCRHLPVGKAGFQSYQWGDKYKYLRTGGPQLFRYMDPIVKFLEIDIPEYYQHVNDDRYIIKNELLQKMGKVWNIECWKQLELAGDEGFKKVDEWFTVNLPNRSPFHPNERYGWRYNAFQTMSEFLSDIAPMRYGYRTHNIIGDGYCQEELGWSKFWGLEYINHYGSHNLFKRMALVFKTKEEEVRKRFKDKVFLQICDNIVKKETSI